MLDPLSPWPALALAAIAWAFAALLSRWVPPAGSGDRYLSIDGLRGYLAFFVFLHHSTVWYGYVRTGSWALPDSRLYIHLGQSSVALFFMITGFLFWSKLLNARLNSFDWLQLYASRVTRLTPLYIVAICLLLLLVAQASGSTLQESPALVLLQTLRWLAFTVTGMPNINGVHNTYVMIAGVPWSLRYEWLFYLSLPALALAIRLVAPAPILVLSVLSLVACLLLPIKPILLATFLGGILAAYLVRIPRLCIAATHPASSVVVAGCIVGAVMLFRGAEALGAVALLAISFSLIACGNTLGGLLGSRASRLLGDVSYGIYLLHGILLYVVFDRLIGIERARELSPLAHWAVAAACVPVLITVALLAFRFVESPGIRATRALTERLRSTRLGQLLGAVPRGQRLPGNH